MNNSRRTAAFVVCRWRTTHEFTSELLPADCADRAFVQDIVYTVVRRYRALRVVLIRFRKSEVNERTIPHVASDEAVEPGHDAPDAFLVGDDDFPQIFRIEPQAEHGRADQIDEHHRQLPALGTELTGLWHSPPVRLERPVRKRGAARRAERLAWKILAAAPPAGHGKRRAAVAAKFVVAAGVRPAARTKHAILLGENGTHHARSPSADKLRQILAIAMRPAAG